MVMKLGTETGSFTNYLLSGSKGQPIPEVGMGVTFLSWTDRHPGTIREVFIHGKWMFIRCTGDDYKRIDNNGMSECQEYEYITRPDEGHGSFFRRAKDDPNGVFEGCSKSAETGRWKKNGNKIRIGSREKYHDFSF